MNEENYLANAFYDEDYIFIKHITGKEATNQQEAELIINNYLENPRGRKWY